MSEIEGGSGGGRGSSLERLLRATAGEVESKDARIAELERIIRKLRPIVTDADKFDDAPDELPITVRVLTSAGEIRELRRDLEGVGLWE